MQKAGSKPSHNDEGAWFLLEYSSGMGVIWTYVNLRLSALYMDQHKSLTVGPLYAPTSNPSIWTSFKDVWWNSLRIVI